MPVNPSAIGKKLDAVTHEYGERDVRVTGRVAPALAGELDAIAARWADLLNGAAAVETGTVAGG